MEGRPIESAQDSLFYQIVGRLRQGKQSSSSSSFKNHQRQQHICSHAHCNPENEVRMIANGTLSAPPLSCNVYLCDFGQVHICSESQCPLYAFDARQTCPLSGIQWGTATASYDKHDSRTWRNGGRPETSDGSHLALLQELGALVGETDATTEAVAVGELNALNAGSVQGVQGVQRVQHNTEDILERGRDLIHRLLYSKYRVQRNRDAKATHIADAERAKQTYVTQRAARRQLPYLTDLLRIHGSYMSQPLPLIDLGQHPDKTRVEYYAHVIAQVWEVVNRYNTSARDSRGNALPLRVDFETVGLGVLYTMRTGFQMFETTILAEDAFLAHTLPAVSDLSYFSINKRKVTSGQILLVNTYRNAVERYHATVHQLLLDATRLPTAPATSAFAT